MADKERCSRPGFSNTGDCVFHARDRTETGDAEFWAAWEKLLNEYEEKHAKYWDFTGFVFPAVPEGPNPFQRVWSQEVYFHGATFKGGMVFHGVTFKGGMFFHGATFKGDVGFAGALFKGVVVFYEATFKGRVDFYGATFKGGVSFAGAMFKGVVVFHEATFEGGVDFAGAVFKEEMVFSEATFEGGVSFAGALFKDRMIFLWATFKGRVDFRGATFEGRVHFGEAMIEHTVDFTNAAFPSRKIDLTDFTALTWGDQGQLVFDRQEPGQTPGRRTVVPGQDLSSLCFSHTALDRVIFRNVTWAKQGRYPGGSGHWLTGDAYRYYRADKPPHAAHVAQVYRRLRTNFEANKRYTEAGGFFIGEMEMVRRGDRLPDTAPWRRRVGHWTHTNVLSARAWYKYMSVYGESYRWAMVWCGLVILAFVGVNVGSGESWGAALEHSAFVFSQLRTDNLLDLLERVLAILLFAQLFIALRRQFERR